MKHWGRQKRHHGNGRHDSPRLGWKGAQDLPSGTSPAGCPGVGWGGTQGRKGHSSEWGFKATSKGDFHPRDALAGWSRCQGTLGTPGAPGWDFLPLQGFLFAWALCGGGVKEGHLLRAAVSAAVARRGRMAGGRCREGERWGHWGDPGWMGGTHRVAQVAEAGQTLHRLGVLQREHGGGQWGAGQQDPALQGPGLGSQGGMWLWPQHHPSPLACRGGAVLHVLPLAAALILPALRGPGCCSHLPPTPSWQPQGFTAPHGCAQTGALRDGAPPQGPIAGCRGSWLGPRLV